MKVNRQQFSQSRCYPLTDQAHIIRRSSGAFYQSCSTLHANSRWCLTGTPIQNKLADLGTLFAFIRVEPFNKASVFRKWIETAFEQTADDPTRVKERLVMLLEALCLRRTKDVLQLPSVRQFEHMFEFNDDEQRQYNNTKSIMMRAIRHRVGEDEKSSKFSLFHATLQLRILCNHGTFQQPFSWQRRSYRDEKDVFGSMRGSESEIKCSGCQHPMPFQGSSGYEGMFKNRCAHILCSECIEQSMASGISSQNRGCPICVPHHDLGASKEASDIVNINTSTGIDSEDNDHAYYFNANGHSTKMEALIQDVSKDLWTTKRRVHPPFLLIAVP